MENTYALFVNHSFLLMISIITSIHNQLGMNKLFYKYLKKNSYHPFQLIVIDNASTDGSGDFFRKQGVDVITNKENFSYAFAQNQGIALAKYEYLLFLNNDVVVSKNWDETALRLMQQHGLEVATCAGTNRMLKKKVTRAHLKKWFAIKYPLLALGNGYKMLNLMHKLFFLFSFNGFCKRFQNKYKGVVVEGIAGFNVLMTKSALKKVGCWDERLLAADFDIFLRTKKRALEVGDIKPVHLLAEVYLHHFLRLTFKSNYIPFADKDKLIRLEDKWDKNEIRELMKTCDQIYFDSSRSSADY